MSLLNLLVVFIGGGLGSIFRYICSRTIPHHILGFINPTIFVNVIGSFLIGCVFAYFTKNTSSTDTVYNSNIYLLITFGFLGGFTTFSTFSLDVLNFLNKGEILNSVLYIISSLLISILAVYSGYLIFK